MLQISPRLPLLLAIAVALGMISATAWQVYSFWQAENSTSGNISQPVARSEQKARQEAPDVNLASIPVFGDESQAEAPPEQEMDNLPETSLRLVLRGVMSASGDLPGSALVEDPKKQTEAYLVGEELPGNAKLRAVRPDRIIIERAGALESLYFPEDEDRSGISLAANDSETTTEYGEQQARPASYPGPETGTTSDARREEIRNRLEQLRNRLRNNN